MTLKPIFLFIVMGVILMVNTRAFSDNLGYERFIGKTLDLGCSLDYISGWRQIEQKGAQGSFDQIIFCPAKEKKGTPQALMALTVEAARGAGQDSVAADLKEKRMQFKEARVISEAKISLCATQAEDILLEYKRLKQMYAVNPEFIVIKERIIILVKDDKIYTLRYENAEDQFADYSPAFEHMIKSLSLK